MAEVASWKRSTVAGLIARMLWKLWKEPTRFEGPLSDPSAYMVHFLKAYGARVAGLAVSVGREDGHAIGPQEVLYLCHRYHLIEEREKEAEASLVRQAQRQHRVFRVGEFSDDLVEHIAVFMPVHRNARAQMALGASWQDILRGWYLLRAADRHSREKKDYDLLGNAPRVLNGLTPQQVVNGAYAFFVLASSSPYNNGGVDMRASVSSDGLAGKMGLTIEDILAVTNRLSLSSEEFRQNWYELAKQLPETERKFARDPMTLRPLIRLDPTFGGIANSTDHYLCVSPRHLLWTLAQLPFEIVETLESRAFDNTPLRTFLGHALEDYLVDLLSRWAGADNVVRLDGLLGERDGRGDVAVFARDRVFVIESTKAIGTVEMRSSYSAGQLLDQWEVLLKKAKQCLATIENRRFQALLRDRGATQVVSMVCVLDPMLVEASLFSRIAPAAKLLELDRIEFVTVEELERVVDAFQPEEVHRLVGVKWDGGDGAEPLGTYAEQNLAAGSGGNHSWRAVRAAASDLLPEFLLRLIEQPARRS